MGYYFVKTSDGSVGLFDEDVNDIYHSTSGAYKEAVDKFVIPSQLERFKNKTCKVLDICYGIGYNTKALLKYSIENNLNVKFKIDALEINNDLIQISPFIKSAKNKYLDFEIDKFILLSYLKSNKINFNKIIETINKNSKFLSLYKPDFDKIIQNHGYNYGVKEKLNAFLHNIYYHNISNRIKMQEISYNLSKNTLKWHINDARKVVFELEDEYDLIFLDAFTASKQPLLWTNQFISRLASLLNKETGIILSYSKCAPYRKALLNQNLIVGTYYNDKKIISTIASYSEKLIKYKLDDFTIGLLNTRAGIPYEDKNLSLTSEEILENRKNCVKNSNLETASKYYKRNNKKHG